MLMRLPIGSTTRTDASAKWGRENCIIWGRVRQADFGPCTHTLSIRAAWGGVEHCHVDGRTIGVDDDNFLILNHGRIYDQHPQRAAGRVAGDLFQPAAGRADPLRGAAAAEFLENLRPHDAAVSPVLHLHPRRHSREVARTKRGTTSS